MFTVRASNHCYAIGDRYSIVDYNPSPKRGTNPGSDGHIHVCSNSYIYSRPTGHIHPSANRRIHCWLR